MRERERRVDRYRPRAKFSRDDKSEASSSCDAMSTATGPTSGGGSQNRRVRYARSSTVSVTQLLQDSCSSLINRITARVRGPSASTSADNNNSAVTKQYKAPDESTARPRTTYRRHYAGDGVSASVSVYRSAKGLERSDALSKSERYQDLSSSPRLHRGRTYDLLALQSHHREPLSSSSSVKCVRLHGDLDRGHRNSSSTKTRLQEDLDYLHPSSKSLRNKAFAPDSKYSFLQQYPQRPSDKYPEPSEEKRSLRPLMKSATTVVLSEKAYPFVSVAAPRGKTRDHTPFRNSRSRPRLKSCHHGNASSSHGRSEHKLAACSASIDVDAAVASSVDVAEAGAVTSTATTKTSSPALTEREVKRKEIQSLIQKYVGAGLEDEDSSQSGGKALVKCQQKYSAILAVSFLQGRVPFIPLTPVYSSFEIFKCPTFSRLKSSTKNLCFIKVLSENFSLPLMLNDSNYFIINLVNFSLDVS